ncbi:MAG: transcriptional repressor [Bacteroidales bacterium]
MDNEIIKNKLTGKGLKVTPQRMFVLEAIYALDNHPTAENIIDYTRNVYPHIAIGTVYKVLNKLVENDLIKKVKTENDVMRYDANPERHHHLYDKESEAIQDYYDEELDALLKKYFKRKNITGFTIEEIVVQINGKFN